jgi:hypothetical protein
LEKPARSRPTLNGKVGFQIRDMDKRHFIS